MKKPFYKSKTIIANFIALIALIVQAQFGFIIDAEEQAAIIIVINLILRIFTRQPLGK